MIKNLLEQDEYKPEENKTERQEKAINELAAEKIAEPQYIEVNEAENLFDSPEATFEKLDETEIQLLEDEIDSINSFVETSGDAPESFNSSFDSTENTFVETHPETKEFSAPTIDSSENSFADESNETASVAPPAELTPEPENSETIASEPLAEAVPETLNQPLAAESASETANFESPVETKIEAEKPSYNNDMLFQPLPEPESFAETARKSGLAYAAAITLTASIVFMLVIGWFADLLFGSSPWGIVGGILLGSLVGFVQFFRMTAQIFKNKD